MITHRDSQIKTLALFDLDHTLIDVDSDYIWGQYIVEEKLVADDDYGITNRQFYENYIDGTLDATLYNEFVARFLRSKTMPVLLQLRNNFIDKKIKPAMRPKGIVAINNHLRLGHEVVITSATNSFLVPAIAELFGIHSKNTLSTPLQIQKDLFTGFLTDRPNFKDGKLYHINKWLKNMERENLYFEGTYAYSDSKNDIPLLEWSDNPVCITPDEVLAKHALTRNWPIENWSVR